MEKRNLLRDRGSYTRAQFLLERAPRILVVDDDAQIQKLLQDALTTEGYNVDLACTALGALELVRNTIYDAAILDVNLPDMHGMILHREIRQMDDELARRTIFISGDDNASDDLVRFFLQETTFLPKPFPISVLLEAVQRVVSA